MNRELQPATGDFTILPTEAEAKIRINNILTERDRREKVALEIAGLQQRIIELQESVGNRAPESQTEIQPRFLSDEEKQAVSERKNKEKSECLTAADNLQLKECKPTIIERLYDGFFSGSNTHEITTLYRDEDTLLITEARQDKHSHRGNDIATVEQYLLFKSIGAAFKLRYSTDDISDVRQFDLNNAELLSDEYWHLINNNLERISEKIETDIISDIALEILNSSGKDASQYPDVKVVVAEVSVAEGSTMKLLSETYVYPDKEDRLYRISVVSSVHGDRQTASLNVGRGEFNIPKSSFKQKLQIMKALMGQSKD